MATGGAPRLSLPLLLPVTTLLLSLLLTGSHALCKYKYSQYLNVTADNRCFSCVAPHRGLSVTSDTGLRNRV